jgi:hypothetical protein
MYYRHHPSRAKVNLSFPSISQKLQQECEEPSQKLQKKSLQNSSQYLQKLDWSMETSSRKSSDRSPHKSCILSKKRKRHVDPMDWFGEQARRIVHDKQEGVLPKNKRLVITTARKEAIILLRL